VKPLIIGTRGSDLAIRQAQPMVDFLRFHGFEISWRRFSTSGDQWLEGPLDKQQGTGFFTKELEGSLLAGEVDLLIHSLKDVSIDRPHGIAAACIPEREDASDWLLTCKDAPASPLIGTSSVRRERMLEAAHPEWRFTWSRGNVPTRVRRVREGELRGEALHGTVLAAAGLKRLDLDLSDLELRALDPSELMPAPGQGALLAECQDKRHDLIEALRPFHHEATARRVQMERAVLAGIGGGCQQPLGAFAELQADGRMRLRAAYADGQGVLRGEALGHDDAQLVDTVLRELGVPCA
jgi:hydroxymethylbilane synthase